VAAEKAATDDIQPVLVMNWPEPKNFRVKRDRQGRMKEVAET